MQIIQHPLCISTDEFEAEGIPARWDVSGDSCGLFDFEIGAWVGARTDAVDMTGPAHIRAQERAVLDWHREREREDRISLRSDNATFIAGE